MRIDIRDRVTEKDPSVIYDIVRDTGFFNDAEALMAKELADATLAKPDEYLFFIAECEEKPVGYACSGNIPCSDGSYEIYWIAVLREFQRLGVGKLLIETVEAAVKRRGGRKIFISTSGTPRYEPTRTFYEKSGYTKAAVLKDYFAPGDDEVVYEKVL
jgi:ribosomal protein S18 acetylase RimI-like enzyme